MRQTSFYDFNTFFYYISDSSFFPNEIAQWCKENYNYFFVVVIDKYCTLRIATKIKRIPNISHYINIVQSMRNAFPLLKKRFIISLLPTPFQKMWNKKDRLTTKHVNSGYTTFKNDATEIVVFRQEEIHKVLFHELIHGLQLHCVSESTFNHINDGSRVDESIVETWATILHGVYVHSRKENNQINIKFIKIEDFDNYFKTLSFKKDKDFILIQAANLLKSHKCTFPDRICMQKFPKVPAIFFYYICKAAFMLKPEQFIRQFWWTKIKKCRNIPIETLNDYLFNPLFLEAMNNNANHYQSMSMKMTALTLA